MKELLERVPAHLREYPAMKRLLEEIEERVKAGEDYPTSNYGIHASPLVEVHSVTIHGNETDNLFANREPCEIYGVVQFVHGEEVLFDLYKREESEPEIVPLGGTISLIGPSNGGVSPLPNIKLKVHLMDKHRKVEIANRVVSFIQGWEDHSQTMQANPVIGECGFATVFYTLFRSAVIGKVKIKILNEEDSYPFKIYGRIYAHRECEFGCPDSEEGKELLSKKDLFACILFNKDESAALEVGHGGVINLSRCSVVVPAYESLIVDLELFHDGRLVIKDAAKFLAQDMLSKTKRFKVDLLGQKCEMEVLVLVDSWQFVTMETNQP